MLVAVVQAEQVLVQAVLAVLEVAVMVR